MAAVFTRRVKARPAELPHEELRTAQGLGQQGVEGTALDLLAHEAHPDEDRDQGTEEVDGGETEVLDDLLVLADRKVAEEKAGEGHGEGEEHQVVEHPLAHGLAKGVGGDGHDAAQSAPPHDEEVGSPPISLKK